MFCLYALPLARLALAKIQMLTTSSWTVTILLKSLIKSLGLKKMFMRLQFQDFVDSAVCEVIKEMKSRHPDKPFDDEQLEKDAFEVIAKFLQGR